MCGRFQFSVTQCPALQPIRSGLAQQQALPCWPDDQIAPSDRAPVLLAGAPELMPALMTWGFPWPGRQPVIHARAETLLERPMFRDAAVQRRCIIPASAFYERDHARQQFRFSLQDGQPLYMAAVWDKRGGMDCFCIITTEANDSVRPTHGRMPLLLPPDQLEPWLLDSAAVSVLLHAAQPSLESTRADGQLQLW